MQKKTITPETEPIVTYNINDMATVYLTAEGVKALLKYYDDLDSHHQEGSKLYTLANISGFKPRTRLYKTELWNIMTIFGKELYMGGKQMFVKNKISIQRNK
jgi:hypothetical protein